MHRNIPHLLTIVLVLMTFVCRATEGDGGFAIVNLKQPLAEKQLISAIEGCTISHDLQQGAILIHLEPVSLWPGVSIRPPERYIDLSPYAYLEVDVQNIGTSLTEASLRVDSPKPEDDHSKPNRLSVGDRGTVAPGETVTLRAELRRQQPGVPILVGMDRFPQGMAAEDDRVNPAMINNLVVFAYQPMEPVDLKVTRIAAVGSYEKQPWESMTAEEFFPMVDALGQFKHQTWPGKVQNLDDLQVRAKEEAATLAEKSHPTTWNQYGGWAKGPHLEATGRFRTAKQDGRWWLVDPEGRLFWSAGVSGMGSSLGAGTAVTQREHYFEWLPEQNDPTWSSCFYTQKMVNRGFYQKQSPLCFDFNHANLIRKFGENWQEKAINMTHQRMHSWGLNTMGCWTRPELYESRKTVYAKWYFYSPRKISGKASGWKRFPDVFAPAYKQQVQEAANKMLADAKDDPWCMGVFTDNELPWLTPALMARCVLTSPKDQPAKLHFIQQLKERYEAIAAFNTDWNSDFDSWDAMQANRAEIHVESDTAIAAAEAFYTDLARTYFSIARDAVKAVDPNFLVLGCRFNGNFPEAARIAEEYCDVLSYNLYRDSVAHFRPTGGGDKPVVIGEFHFGAPDRGVFGAGLRPTGSQKERAEAFASYMRGAIRNPFIVGAHWFTWRNEPTTARPLDQENHQIGFVDVTDTPHQELVDACREVTYSMYDDRSAPKEVADSQP